VEINMNVGSGPTPGEPGGQADGDEARELAEANESLRWREAALDAEFQREAAVLERGLASDDGAEVAAARR
jgi:hypothetical protein